MCNPTAGPVSLWVTLVVLCVIFVGWMSYKLLVRYAHPNTAWFYLFSVWLSWVLGFVGIFLLPIDMCVSLATNCASSVPGIVQAWQFVYWTTFIMAWLVDPLLQSFHNDGSYDWKSRAKAAINENVRFYVVLVGIIVAVIVVLGIFYTALWQIDFMAVIFGIANAYGFLLIVLMLGYGMIAAPRDLWYMSDTPSQLERMYFLAPIAHAKAEDADYDLRVVVEAIENASQRVKSGR
jgi:hypothetical protein